MGGAPCAGGTEISTPVRRGRALGRPGRKSPRYGGRQPAGAGPEHARGDGGDPPGDRVGDCVARTRGRGGQRDGCADNGRPPRVLRRARFLSCLGVQHCPARRLGGAGDYHHVPGGARAQQRIPGFSGYYFWLVVFGVLATLMAVGGPVVVVRQWMQKFGIWVVVGASLWLTYHLFDAYDVGAIWDRSGEGGFPNFFQGVDLVVALPISWLPLVCDYNRFARRGSAGAIATYIGYSVANAWFFALGVFYVQALQTDPGGFIDSLVTMLLPLSAGWLALIVLLAGETDEGFANVYSTAVSIQNLAPKLRHALIAVAVGVIAVIIAISIDLVQYENFLLLIGGVFVPVFGIFIADYFIVRRRSYEMEELYRGSGEYWYTKGVNLLAVTVWVTGFLLYSLAAQPPWLLEKADFISWAPTWATHIGGTMPALVFSFVAYWAGAQWLLRPRRAEASAIPASAEGS